MTKKDVKEKIMLLEKMATEYKITKDKNLKQNIEYLARELKDFMFNKGNYHIESGKVSDIILNLND